MWLAEVTLSSELVICRGCGAEKDHVCPVPGETEVLCHLCGQHGWAASREDTGNGVKPLCTWWLRVCIPEPFHLQMEGKSTLLGYRNPSCSHTSPWCQVQPNLSECGCVAQPGERGCGLVELGVRKGVLATLWGLWGWWVKVFGHCQHQLDG